MAKMAQPVEFRQSWIFDDYLQTDAIDSPPDAAGSASESDFEPAMSFLDINAELAVEQSMFEESTNTKPVAERRPRDYRQSNYRNPIPFDVLVNKVNKEYLLPRMPTVTARVPNSDPEFVAFQSACDKLFRHPTVCIKSPMNTGKTEAYMNYLTLILDMFPQLRVLLITARISLTSSLLARAAERNLSFVGYNQKEAKQSNFLSRQSRVIVQVDSLPKLMPKGSSANGPSLGFDVVLMDESESMLHHFSAGSLKNNAVVWNCFKAICYKSTQRICVDADLGARTCKMMQHFHSRLYPAQSSSSQSPVAASAEDAQSTTAEIAAVPGAVECGSTDSDSIRFAAWVQSGPTSVSTMHTMVNTRRTDTRRYVMLKSEDRFYIRLRLLLNKGRRVVIPTNERKTADAINDFILTEYPHLKVLYYHGEKSQQMKEGAALCHTLWVQYDVVIYTPTIVYGVDFNPSGVVHFDAILAFGVSMSNVVREFMQMLGRVRKLRSDMVYVYIPDSVGADAGRVNHTTESVQDDLDRDWNHYEHTHTLAPMLREEYFDDDAQVKARYHDLLFRDLFVANLLEKKTSMQNFKEMFCRAVEERGGILLDEDETPFTDRMLQDAELLDALSTHGFLLRCMGIAYVKAAPCEHLTASQRLGRRYLNEQPPVQQGVYDPFTNLDEVARQLRIQQQQFLEEDHAHVKFHQLCRQYNLAAMSIACTSKLQRGAMCDLVRLHGQPSNIKQFEAFCRINSSTLYNLAQWRQAMRVSDVMPLQRIEREWLNQVVMVKGLLALVGFTASRTLANCVAHRNDDEEMGDGSIESCEAEVTGADLTTGVDVVHSEEDATGNRKRSKINHDRVTLALLNRTSPASVPDSDATHQSDGIADLAAVIAGGATDSGYCRALPRNSVVYVIHTADVCSKEAVTTASIAARLQEFNTVEWLWSQTVAFKAAGIKFKVKGAYSVKDVMSLLDRTLQRLLGFGVGKGVPCSRPRVPLAAKSGRKRSRSSSSSSVSSQTPIALTRSRPANTMWQLETDRRDSMLELAYAVSLSPYVDVRRCVREWNVEACVHQAELSAFRWCRLTGIELPMRQGAELVEASASAGAGSIVGASADRASSASYASSTSRTSSPMHAIKSVVVGHMDIMRDVDELARVTKQRKRQQERSRLLGPRRRTGSALPTDDAAMRVADAEARPSVAAVAAVTDKSLPAAGVKSSGHSSGAAAAEPPAATASSSSAAGMVHGNSDDELHVESEMITAYQAQSSDYCRLQRMHQREVEVRATQRTAWLVEQQETGSDTSTCTISVTSHPSFR